MQKKYIQTYINTLLSRKRWGKLITPLKNPTLPTKYLEVSVNSDSNRTTDYFSSPWFPFFWWAVALSQSHRAQHLHLATPAGDKGLIPSASPFKIVLTFSYIQQAQSSIADWPKLLLLKTSTVYFRLLQRENLFSTHQSWEWSRNAHSLKHMTWFLMPSSSSSFVVLSWKTRNWKIRPFVPTAWTVTGRSRLGCDSAWAQQGETKHRKWQLLLLEQAGSQQMEQNLTPYSLCAHAKAFPNANMSILALNCSGCSLQLSSIPSRKYSVWG